MTHHELAATVNAALDRSPLGRTLQGFGEKLSRFRVRLNAASYVAALHSGDQPTLLAAQLRQACRAIRVDVQKALERLDSGTPADTIGSGPHAFRMRHSNHGLLEFRGRDFADCDRQAKVFLASRRS